MATIKGNSIKKSIVIPIELNDKIVAAAKENGITPNKQVRNI